MISRLRIFLSSPGDVSATREIAALTIERLAQDYARHVRIEPYLWEYEAMVASGHFQDSIEPPSAFDIVVLIVWSRLGTPLPVRTNVREYRGLDGRAPVTGTEWEFEEALLSAQARGTPDLLVYRSREDARVNTRDAESRRLDIAQLEKLDQFWLRHFADRANFLGAYTEFASGAEFAAAFEKHLRKLIEKRIAAQPANGRDAGARLWAQAPFRGLESYEFEHAPIFFGQDDALAKAMVQLVASAEARVPFLLLLGASGSGKSSLAKAGIVPKLFVPRRIPGIAFLRRVVFRPGDAQGGEDLFDALARTLATRISEDEGVPELIGPGQSVAGLAGHLRNASAEPAYPLASVLGQLTLGARQAGRMLEYETARLVLVLDQLEELFTNELLTPDERRHFIALVAGLVRSGQVWVIATMRKDFWHQADDTPELVRLAEGGGRLELLPPSQTQLSQMISRPAVAAGIAFERHPTTDVPLSDVIAEEVARESGALPLLSYLLDQLYRGDVLEANGTTLRFATYERLGRLGGAIANRAEAVLQRCAPEDHPALGSVLFALIQMGTTEGDVDRAISRRAPLSAFVPGTAQRRLVEALLHPDARLLVSDAEAGGQPTVRVAHEALIARWERARDFVEGNAEALRIRRRIEERCALWRKLEETGESVDGNRGWVAGWRARRGRVPGLLADIDLVDGQRLLRDHRADTEPHLVDYIERSTADDRRLRSRAVRVLSVVVSVVTVLALVASGAGMIALRKQHEAETQAQQALDAQLRMLTATAGGRLQDADTAGAQGIILEVLADRRSSAARSAEAIDVFQEARAADTGLALLIGHGDAAVSAAFSPDGRRVVTASLDKTARIWDAGSGVQLAVLSGHEEFVSAASFSQDGQRLLTTSGDGTAGIWDAASGSRLGVLAGNTDKLREGDWSPDGKRIVTASVDGTARVWDAASGTLLTVLSGHEADLRDAAFSPDGLHILTASVDKTARIWDAASGRQVALFSGHLGTVTSAAFSPDGQRVVTASYDKTARIWDAAGAGLLAVLAGHTDIVWSAGFSPDGLQILTTSSDRTARVWNAATADQLMVLRDRAESIPAAAFSPDGGRIVSTSMDGTARIWGTTNAAQVAMPRDVEALNESAEFSPDGGRIVIAYSDAARIRDAASGALLATLAGHEDEVLDAAFSPDGARVITASGDRTARIWDAANGGQLLALSGHEDRVRTAAFSPDGQRAVTASNDHSARLWDAMTGKQLAVLAHDGLVREAMFSPDGQRVVTAADDHTVRLWEAATARQVATLPGHGDHVNSVAFSPDGQHILTASDDRTVRVWDITSGEQLVVLTGHDDLIWHAAWSPDGSRILTASDDRTARVWDATSGMQLAVFSGYGHYVRAAAWSPDGRRIVTSAVDEPPRISDVGSLPDLDAQIAWVEAAQWEVLADDERLQLGLPADARTRSGPEGEAEEFARLGADHEAAAVAASTAPEKRALLLQAFAAYAAAVQHAQAEDLPDDAWKAWRYRRATLARLLAREGMMAQVAEAYIAVRDDGRRRDDL